MLNSATRSASKAWTVRDRGSRGRSSVDWIAQEPAPAILI